MPDNLAEVLNYASHYDYIERTYGYFKYQQESLHKSNVYSIIIRNSGLNPTNNEQVSLFNKTELVNRILNLDEFKGYKFIDNTFRYFDPNNHAKLNNRLNLLLPYDDSVIPLDDSLLERLGFVKVKQDDEILYYNEAEKLSVSKINNIRKNMRTLLETAIRNSVQKYMPVETILWKIIYEGK